MRKFMRVTMVTGAILLAVVAPMPAQYACALCPVPSCENDYEMMKMNDKANLEECLAEGNPWYYALTGSAMGCIGQYWLAQAATEAQYAACVLFNDPTRSH